MLFETILNQRIVLERIGYVTIFIGASMMIFGAAMFVMTITGQEFELAFFATFATFKTEKISARTGLYFCVYVWYQLCIWCLCLAL